MNVCLFSRIRQNLNKCKVSLRNILLSNTARFNSNSNQIFCRINSYSCLNVEKSLCKRSFHLSCNRKALSPTNIWQVLQSLTEISGIVTGRLLRTWWKNLLPNERVQIVNKIKTNQTYIITGCGLFSGLAYTFYITHLVEDPITGRKRLRIFSEKQVMELVMYEVNNIMENYKGQIVKYGYQYNKVLRVSHKILSANSHLPGIKRNWQVIVINDLQMKNVFASLSGHIFIFTGMFEEISNTDQLAAIIAHEIAHVVLCHTVEVVSKVYLMDLVTPLILLAWCTLVPGSIVFTFLATKCLQILVFYMPFNRSLELEADTLGLEMMARACYNPKEVSLFWRKMDTIEEFKKIEWLSTHPSHKKRYKTVDEHMSVALKIFADHCVSEKQKYVAPKDTYVFK